MDSVESEAANEDEDEEEEEVGGEREDIKVICRHSRSFKRMNDPATEILLLLK